MVNRPIFWQLIQLLVFTVFGLLLWCVGSFADNSQQGQNEWCWAASSSSVVFCDYPTLGSCRSANQRKEDGDCVRRR